jgi:hypothetical protein
MRAACAIVRRRTIGCERREKLEGSAHDDLNSFTAGTAPLSHLYGSQLVRQEPSRREVVAPRDLSETNADLDVAVVRSLSPARQVANDPQ